MRKELGKLKYFLLYLLLVIGLFVYTALTGRRFTGSDSTQWSPQEEKGHHK